MVLWKFFEMLQHLRIQTTPPRHHSGTRDGEEGEAGSRQILPHQRISPQTNGSPPPGLRSAFPLCFTFATNLYFVSFLKETSVPMRTPQSLEKHQVL